MPILCPFLTPGSRSADGQLAILHLRRDHSIPTIVSTEVPADQDQGYAEGNVVNTRFGSFPHTTLINQPWGSQVRASIVDTGSRGRGKKRKRESETDGGELKEAVAAGSGFLHILPPTPENWTMSLPHRTQVVYTPDYSYILHRIKARPGSAILEAGSGSGSFTHAAARAVFNGYSSYGSTQSSEHQNGRSKQWDIKHGHVFTYEYHAERYKKVVQEMKEHGLEEIVTASHRDVYHDGFLVGIEHSSNESQATKASPGANAIFLDLPAPWMALPHLTRESTSASPSALDPTATVHICTFSPCIEQAQRTVSELRRRGWIDIEMVEMAHKRIDIRREYTGLEYEGMRGANGVPATVDDAVQRLREVEERAKVWRGQSGIENDDELASEKERLRGPNESERREAAKERDRTMFKKGKLVHRPEPEVKTHTSYLVFAILPREWSLEDERKIRLQWENNSKAQAQAKKSKKQKKREAKQKPEGEGNASAAVNVEKDVADNISMAGAMEEENPSAPSLV